MDITDADRRAVILRQFYDKRHAESWVNPSADLSNDIQEQNITNNICRQLKQGNLIEWNEILSGPGFGRITNLGVDVIEGNTVAPMAITIDSRKISVHGSSNVQIGNQNVQRINSLNEVEIIEKLLNLYISNNKVAIDSETRHEMTNLVRLAKEGKIPDAKPLFEKFFGFATETVKNTAWGILANLIAKGLGIG